MANNGTALEGGGREREARKRERCEVLTETFSMDFFIRDGTRKIHIVHLVIRLRRRRRWWWWWRYEAGHSVVSALSLCCCDVVKESKQKPQEEKETKEGFSKSRCKRTGGSYRVRIKWIRCSNVLYGSGLSTCQIWALNQPVWILDPRPGLISKP